MPKPVSPPNKNTYRMTDPAHTFDRLLRPVRGFGRAVVFFLKVFPMLPSRPVDWVTKTPVIERVRYPSLGGEVDGEIYRPPGPGPHPGMLVCLGVVPFEVDHPQVPVLGRALARAGFAALLYWSPAMRDFRLDPEDLENIPLAYDWFVRHPYIDASRSGLLGTCVGGAFSLMAAASSLIRERVAFVGVYAPFSSMWTFARDIASYSVDSTGSSGEDAAQPWKVDPLTRKVFVHSMTAWLNPDEAERLRGAFESGGGAGSFEGLSEEGQAICSLLSAPGRAEAEKTLRDLPPAMQERLAAMSPDQYLKAIQAPLIVLLHDAGDQVIPVGESRRLVEAFNGRVGVSYTEMHFSHLDPVKGRLPPHRLLGEFLKFFGSLLPVFLRAVD